MRAAGRGVRGLPPPSWDQKIFSPVPFFRKLILHRFLCLKLFCSSKIVDFRAYFVKFSAPQTFFPFGFPHFYNLAPPFSNARCDPEMAHHIGRHISLPPLSPFLGYTWKKSAHPPFFRDCLAPCLPPFKVDNFFVCIFVKFLVLSELNHLSHYN